MALAHMWSCPFVEASAKNRLNVNEVFAEIVREMNVNPTQKDNNYLCCLFKCCSKMILKGAVVVVLAHFFFLLKE
ncbi:hypothetical protein Anas_10893 [Armadillidium nasatum]|uniref:Uncharacterized protein n=1 Tax=Armadillidium nasatum TaxID=96803 RepID=A0A5N5SLH2_9CRUS|nr:hypothetical protein Anas_10893 [Armadillidium nasatum]